MRFGVVSGVVCITVLSLMVGLGAASARTSGRVFYLAVHPRQCLVVPTSGTSKTVVVVTCSNPAHDLEVFAVGHGGWGHQSPPAYRTAYAIAKSVCFAAFRRLTGHLLGSSEGWLASWPDPGAETARYGDEIVCGLRTWPRFTALGSGWHVH